MLSLSISTQRVQDRRSRPHSFLLLSFLKQKQLPLRPLHLVGQPVLHLLEETSTLDRRQKQDQVQRAVVPALTLSSDSSTL